MFRIVGKLGKDAEARGLMVIGSGLCSHGGSDIETFRSELLYYKMVIYDLLANVATMLT